VVESGIGLHSRRMGISPARDGQGAHARALAVPRGPLRGVAGRLVPGRRSGDAFYLNRRQGRRHGSLRAAWPEWRGPCAHRSVAPPAHAAPRRRRSWRTRRPGDRSTSTCSRPAHATATRLALEHSSRRKLYPDRIIVNASRLRAPWRRERPRCSASRSGPACSRRQRLHLRSRGIFQANDRERPTGTGPTAAPTTSSSGRGDDVPGGEQLRGGRPAAALPRVPPVRITSRVGEHRAAVGHETYPIPPAPTRGHSRQGSTDLPPRAYYHWTARSSAPRAGYPLPRRLLETTTLRRYELGTSAATRARVARAHASLHAGLAACCSRGCSLRPSESVNPERDAARCAEQVIEALVNGVTHLSRQELAFSTKRLAPASHG